MSKSAIVEDRRAGEIVVQEGADDLASRRHWLRCDQDVVRHLRNPTIVTIHEIAQPLVVSPLQLAQPTFPDS